MFQNDRENLAYKLMVKFVCFLVVGCGVREGQVGHRGNASDDREHQSRGFFFSTESVDTFCVWYERQPWRRHPARPAAPPRSACSPRSCSTTSSTRWACFVLARELAPASCARWSGTASGWDGLSRSLVGIVMALTFNVFGLTQDASFQRADQFGLESHRQLSLMGVWASTSGLCAV